MPKTIITIPGLTENIKSLFLSKIAYTANPNACWEWTGSTNGNNYGKISFSSNGKKYLISSHRLSFFIYKNEDPKDKVILHTCDNRKCVNPNHLHIGSHRDNSIDMIKKGRGKEQFEGGESHKMSKLKLIDIENIKKEYASGKTQVYLSLKYKVYQSTISRIVNNKRWN